MIGITSEELICKKDLVNHRFLEVDFENLPADPGERKHISCYLQKGPCKPRERDFPK